MEDNNTRIDDVAEAVLKSLKKKKEKVVKINKYFNVGMIVA